MLTKSIRIVTFLHSTLKYMIKKFVCDGECNGSADKPGVCTETSCSHYGRALRAVDPNTEIQEKKRKKIDRRLFLYAGLGFFFFIFPWTQFIAPHLLQLPSDFEFSAQIISVDDFFDESRGDYVGPQFSKTTYSYETLSSENGVLIISNVFNVRNLRDEPIVHIERKYGIRAKTGEHLPEYGDTRRSGYLFAPRHIEDGRDFTYWHVNYDGPAHMSFVAEEELFGFRVYRYETRYEGVVIDQTDNLGFLPGVGVERGVELEPFLTLWIDPVSGRLIKYEDDTVAYFYDLETGERIAPWNHFSNTFHDESIKENILVASREQLIIVFVEFVAPFLLFVFSVLLLAFYFNFFKVFKNVFTKKRILFGFGLLFVLSGLVSLFGWIIGSEILVRPFSFASAMNPLTALCFVAVGLILFFKNIYSRSVLFLGAFLFVVGLVRILGFVGFIPFNVDLLLYRDAVLNFPFPARMALYTAVSFALLGAAVLVNFSKLLRSIFFAEILSITVLVLPVLSGMNFIFGSSSFIQLPIFFSSSVATVILFVLAGSAVWFKLSDPSRTKLSAQNKVIIFSILLLFMFIIVSAITLAEQAFFNEARNKFLVETDRVTRAIENRMDVYANVLQGTEGLFAASDNVSRSEFKSYVDALDIQKNYPGVQGIGYAVFVKPEDVPQHVSGIRSEGFPSYSIKPEGNRELYSAITYIEPFDERNREAFGFDMYSNRVRRSAMDQARDTGEPALSGHIVLVQEIDEDVQPGFLLYVPFYENGTTNETLEAKRENIVGYVYSAFRATNFFNEIVGADDIADIGLTVVDGIEQTGPGVLYDDVSNKVSVTETPRFTESKTIYVFGRPWTLTFSSTSSFGETNFSKFTSIVLIIVGIAVSSLLTLVFYTSVSSRQRAVEYANRVTEDLSRSKKDLEKANSEISDKLNDLERFNKLMVGRELKMIELKEELKKRGS